MKYHINNKIHPAAYGVVLYMMVVVARLPELYPALRSIHLGKTALLITLIGLFFSSRKNINIFNQRLSKLIIYFSVIAILSLIFSIWLSRSLEFLTGTFLSDILIFFFILITSDNKKTFSLYIKTLIFCGIILSANLLLTEWKGRLSVTGSYDANDLAMIMVIFIAITFALYQCERKILKYIYASVIFLFVLTVVLTASRGGLLGLITLFIYIMWMGNTDKIYSNKKRISITKLLGLIIILLVAINIAPPETKNRFMTIFTLEEDYNLTSEQGRVAIWSRGFELMIQNPLGIGLDNFSIGEGQISNQYRAAHNAFLQVGVELGIIGLFIYLLLFKNSINILRGIIKSKNQITKSSYDYNDGAHIYLANIAAGLLGAIISSIVSMMFLSSAYSGIIYILFSLVASLKIISEKKISDNTVINK